MPDNEAVTEQAVTPLGNPPPSDTPFDGASVSVAPPINPSQAEFDAIDLMCKISCFEARSLITGDGYSEKPCMIYDSVRHLWMCMVSTLGTSAGWIGVEGQANATVTTLACAAAEIAMLGEGSHWIVLLPMDTPIHYTPPKKEEIPLKMEDVLHPALVALATLAPQNKQLHALLLQKMGKMPPPEADTYEKLSEWFSATFKYDNYMQQNSQAGRPTLATTQPRPRRNAAIYIDVSFSSQVYGTCRYSGTESGSGEFAITREVLEEAMGECDTIGELVDHISGVIDQEAFNAIDPVMDTDDEGYDYDRCEIEDSDGVEASFNATRLRRMIGEWIEANADDEMREKFGV